MNHFRRLFAAVATLACALLTLAAAPAAFAMQVPLPGEGDGGALAPVYVTGGMPGWQITLIAVGTALVAATAAVLVDRVLAARKAHTSAA
jgi:hypothetical protein